MGNIYEVDLKIKKIKSKGISSGFGTFSTYDQSLYNYLISETQNILGRDIICRPYYRGEEKEEYLASFHNRRIFIKGLDPNWTDEEISKIFLSKWPIERAYAIRDHNGISQTYGYVNFVNYEDAKQSLKDRFLKFEDKIFHCFPYYKSKDYNRIEQQCAGNPLEKNLEDNIQYRRKRRARGKKKKKWKPNIDFETKEPMKCVILKHKRLVFKINNNHNDDNLVLTKEMSYSENQIGLSFGESRNNS